MFLIGAAAASAQTGTKPGVGPRDGRTAIDVGVAPWASVVRVNTEAGVAINIIFFTFF